MKNSVRKTLYILLVIFMLLTFYSIFNAGNPNSFFRFVIKDSSYDITITIALSLIVALLVIMLTAGRENSLRHMLEINRDHILDLRSRGKSDDQIAESFLKELGGKKGFLYSLAKRRVLHYLTKIE